jgi:hypothetical protein
MAPWIRHSYQNLIISTRLAAKAKSVHGREDYGGADSSKRFISRGLATGGRLGYGNDPHGLVSVLRKIHDDLDAAVLDAYSWPHDLTDEQIIERLVALNAERAAEEERGVVRWLRPDFQQGEAKPIKPKQVTMPGVEATPTAPSMSAAQWPKTFSDRIVSVRSALSSRRAWSAREMAERFKSAGKRAPKKADVEEILEGLRALGLALRFEERGESKWAATARSD